MFAKDKVDYIKNYLTYEVKGLKCSTVGCIECCFNNKDKNLVFRVYNSSGYVTNNDNISSNCLKDLYIWGKDNDKKTMILKDKCADMTINIIIERKLLGE